MLTVQHRPIMRKWLAHSIMLACLSCGMTSVAVVPSNTAAHELAALEEQVKAAMVFKFLSYIDWPPASFEAGDSAYRVWVLGAEHIEEELRLVSAERTVNNRPVDVLAAKSLRSIKRPHVVFVGREYQRYLPKLAHMAQNGSFVIITEHESGLIDGSTINLRLIDGRMGFDVSLDSAHNNGLKLSARLLSVASSIQSSP